MGGFSMRVVSIGIGYIGLPLTCLFAQAGLPCIGLTRSEKKAKQRREEAIERQNKITCSTRDGEIIETTKKELENKSEKLED